MFSCTRASNDPLLQIMLKNHALHVLRWPLTGISPGELVIEKGRRTLRTPTDTVFKVGLQARGAGRRDMADLEETFSGKLDAKAGVTLTDRLALLFGGAGGSLRAAYADASKLVLRIRLAEWLDVDTAALSAFLVTAQLREDQGLVDEGDRLYVITGVAMARALEILAYNAQDAQIKANVTGPVSPAVGIALSAEQGGGIVYRSLTPVAFGVELFRLIVSNGRWKLEGVDDYVQVRGGNEGTANGDENPLPKSAVAFIGDRDSGDPFIELLAPHH